MMGLPKMDGFKVHQFFRSFVGSPCRAMAKKTTGQSWWRIPEDRSESTRRSTPEMQEWVVQDLFASLKLTFARLTLGTFRPNPRVGGVEPRWFNTLPFFPQVMSISIGKI